MSNMNLVVLQGNMTHDPEGREVASTKLTKFRLAVNDNYKKNDKVVEKTTYVDVDVWGRQAEVIYTYFKKGSPIIVQGRLEQDNWEDADGNKRSKHKVRLTDFSFVGHKSDKGDTTSTEVEEENPKKTKKSTDDDSEIPF